MSQPLREAELAERDYKLRIEAGLLPWTEEGDNCDCGHMCTSRCGNDIDCPCECADENQEWFGDRDAWEKYEQMKQGDDM